MGKIKQKSKKSTVVQYRLVLVTDERKVFGSWEKNPPHDDEVRKLKVLFRANRHQVESRKVERDATK